VQQQNRYALHASAELLVLPAQYSDSMTTWQGAQEAGAEVESETESEADTEHEASNMRPTL